MPMTVRGREKLIELGRHALAILGGGVMISLAHLLLLIRLISGGIFLLLVLLFGILIGMMTTELSHAVLSGLLAFFTGILAFFGFILLSMGGTASLALADFVLTYAMILIIPVLPLTFLAAVLAGPAIGRIVGPQWYPVKIGKHQLKVPLPPKKEA